MQIGETMPDRPPLYLGFSPVDLAPLAGNLDALPALHGLPACIRGSEAACRIEAKERIALYGSAVLTTAELISVALGITERSAQDLLDDLGGLVAVFKAPVGSLIRAKGVGKKLALRLKAIGELSTRIEASPWDLKRIVVSAPEDLASLIRPFRLREREYFWLALLNARNALIGLREVAQGTADACALHPRDLFSVALLEGATGIILIHNHPSGNPKPSQEDLALTDKIRDGAKVLGLRLLDHLIVAGDRVISLRQLGMW